MQTIQQLYNQALARLGGEQLPVVLTGDDSPLILCENAFPHVLDLALSAHDWSFAKTRSSLSKNGDAPEGSGFCFSYNLPATFLRAIRLEGHAGINSTPPYVIEGQRLLTDADPALLLHISRVNTPSRWPAHFADALIWGLAGELASARMNDSAKQQWCYENYSVVLAHAVAQDLTIQNPRPVRSAWNAARFGGGD